VDLDYARIEISGERRHPRHLIIGHGHHDAFGFETLISRSHNKPVAILPKTVHFDSVPHWQLEFVRVVHQVVSHLLLRGERVATRREAQPGESRISRRIEEA
jgi:hypothetical protein